MEESEKYLNEVVNFISMNLTNDTYLRIVNAKLYIDENYQDAIDLDSVSKKALISKFHFHRLFRRIYKKTPHEYITRKRMDRAKELLSENKPVTQVCNEVGFESITSFSILFKKEIGFAPQYYRNMAWQKKQETINQPKKFIPGCFIDSYNLEGK
jgi:AraC-like DNA-binding protein